MTTKPSPSPPDGLPPEGVTPTSMIFGLATAVRNLVSSAAERAKSERLCEQELLFHSGNRERAGACANEGRKQPGLHGVRSGKPSTGREFRGTTGFASNFFVASSTGAGRAVRPSDRDRTRPTHVGADSTPSGGGATQGATARQGRSTAEHVEGGICKPGSRTFLRCQAPRALQSILCSKHSDMA